MRNALAPTAVLLLLAACSRSSEPTPVAAPPEQLSGPASVVHAADPKAAAQLLQGWHGVEQGSWRWTQKQFSVALKPPGGGQPATLQLKFSLPDVLIQRLQSITLSATVNGTPLPPQTYQQAGAQVYTQSVPGAALVGEAVRVDFTLDKALAPSDADHRELGVVVSSVSLE